jgi:hypothetical protein
MDAFEPGHQFGDSDFQLADHNPGVSQGGLLWTMPIPRASIPGSEDSQVSEASFCLTDAQMPDFGNLLTSLWGGGAVDGQGMPLRPVFGSSVSLQAKWFSPGSRQVVRDPVNRFIYDRAETSASIKWKSFRRGAIFESDDKPQQVLFAAIGSESNGSFFH